MEKKLIARILSGKATENEKNDFFIQCEANEELKKEFIWLKNLWALSVNEHLPDERKSFEQFWEKTQKIRAIRIKRVLPGISKYAAVLILAFGLACFFMGRPNGRTGLIQSFKSEHGSVSLIKLEDGSKIWLNSATEIKITEKNEKHIVANLSGEAYFEIVHNPQREFIVNADKIRVRDQGTAFNIRAYPADGNVVTSLKNGKVEVEWSAYKSHIVSMSPNDQLIFQKSTNKYTVEQTDASYIAGWKDGKFVFINKSLREICDELEKWYDVKIKICNKKLGDAKYSSILKRTTTITHMLEMLKITTGLEYDIKVKKNESDMIIIK